MKNIKETYMKIAELFAEHSTCKRLQVGAVIVKNGRIISTGYNGVPSGMNHCCDIFKDCDLNDPDFKETHGQFSAKYELHAEQNAIIEAGKNGVNIIGADLYTTVQPCKYCRKLIIQSGIKKVYYRYPYDRNDYDDDCIFKEFNVEIEKI